MKPTLVFAAALFMNVSTMPPGGCPQDSTGNEATHEEAIRAVVARYTETWNANDMTEWGELFTDDVDYVHRGGGWWKSNEENVEGHRRLHERLARQNQEMNLQLSVAAIHFLHSDIALVHVTSKWPGFDGTGDEGSGLGGIMTMVMVQKGGGWRIRALQNTLVSNPVP